MKYIKKDMKSAIKNAECIYLYDVTGTENIIRPAKGQDFTDFCREGLKREYSKMVIHYRNGGKTTVEVTNRSSSVK